MKKLARALLRHSDVLAIVVIVLAVGGLNTFWNSRQVSSVNRLVAQQHRVIGQQRKTVSRLDAVVEKLRREVAAECGFNSDLAGLPVTVNPTTGKASLLGVKIVSDVRSAFVQAGCAGSLARPAPSFSKWARFYHLRVRQQGRQ